MYINNSWGNRRNQLIAAGDTAQRALPEACGGVQVTSLPAVGRKHARLAARNRRGHYRLHREEAARVLRRGVEGR